MSMKVTNPRQFTMRRFNNSSFQDYRNPTLEHMKAADAVSLGDYAGEEFQQPFAIAIGSEAGRYVQNYDAIAIGHQAGT